MSFMKLEKHCTLHAFVIMLSLTVLAKVYTAQML